MTMLSVVIPTAALSPNSGLSSGKQPHAFRAYLLRNFLLPRLLADPLVDEVIIVGNFEPGTGYQYIALPSVEQSSIHDGLRKRDAGCRAAKGDWILVMNDDHLLDPEALRNAYAQFPMCDVLSPARWTRLRNTAGEHLNGGEPGQPWAGDGHINGHGAFYKRTVLETCPWSAVERVFTLDVQHTQQVLAAGFHVLWTEDVKVWDIEAGAQPWI